MISYFNHCTGRSVPAKALLKRQAKIDSFVTGLSPGLVPILLSFKIPKQYPIKTSDFKLQLHSCTMSLRNLHRRRAMDYQVIARHWANPQWVGGQAMNLSIISYYAVVSEIDGAILLSTRMSKQHPTFRPVIIFQRTVESQQWSGWEPAWSCYKIETTAEKQSGQTSSHP